MDISRIRRKFAGQKQGVLAHLARARHWQCRGERFESAILHSAIRLRQDTDAAFVVVVVVVRGGEGEEGELVIVKWL